MSKSTSKESSIRGKVMPSLITAGIVSLVTTLIPGGWHWVFAKCQVLWGWLVDVISIPIWLLILLSLISLAFVVAMGLLIFEVTRKPEAAIAARYTEDTIFGIRWRWSYGQHGIFDLYSFCPRCDMQVHPCLASAYRAVDFVAYHCDDCGNEIQSFEFARDEVESRVRRKIQQTIRRMIRETDAQTVEQ